MTDYQRREPPLMTMRQKRVSQMERDERGLQRLTPDYIQYCAEQAGLYSTPKLNTVLYLHYKGFTRIEALEEYVNLKSLWLECNGVQEISGLDHLKKLRMLYLQSNCIKEIKGLSNLVNLSTLNLSHNQITHISGLENCVNLNQLDISHNIISDLACCEQLKKLPNLTSFDLRDNLVDQKDLIIPFFSEMPNLLALYLKNNPCIRMVNHLRKNLLQVMPQLSYLDERPVTEIERLTADAFVRGGVEEETRVRDEYNLKKSSKQRNNTEMGAKVAEQGRLKRKANFKKMIDEVKKERADLVDRRQELKQEYKQLPDDSSQKSYALKNLRDHEEVIKYEYVSKLQEQGESQDVIFEAMGKASYKTNKQFQQELEKKYKEEKQNITFQEQLIDQAQKQDYQRTQDSVSSQHTQAINFHPQQEGAVSGTSSEDEIKQGILVKDLNQVRWTPKLELQLEEILIRNQFDFKAAARQFQQMLNRDESDAVFKIDVKLLQLRWTDVEIRKHAMPQMQELDEEQQQEELPPLEPIQNQPAKSDDESEDNGQYFGNDLEELD